MKYTLHINQEKCIQFGLNLQEGAFVDLFSQLPMWAESTHNEGGLVFYKLTAGKIAKELPIISDKKNTILVIIKKLIEKKILERVSHDNNSYYRLTDVAKGFIFGGVEKNQEGVDNFQEGCGKKSIEGVEKNQDNNTTSYNTTSYNIISKDITVSQDLPIEKIEYGNKEINDTLLFLRKVIGITDFKEPSGKQRMFCKHIINLTNKIGKEEMLARLRGILEDDFKAKNCNKIVFLYGELKSYIHSPVVPQKCKATIV